MPELKELFILQERQRMTNAELARRVGTAPQYMSGLRHGRVKNTTLFTYICIAGALGYKLKLEKQ